MRRVLSLVAVGGLVGALAAPAVGGGAIPAAQARRGACWTAAVRGRGSVAGYQLGAIDFISPRFGFGLTAPAVPCYRRVKGGYEVDERRQLQRLVVTYDGGATWRRSGVVPATRMMGTGYTVAVRVASPSRIWVETAAGSLWYTGDRGTSWTPVRFGGVVLATALSGSSLWVVHCRGRMALGGCAARLSVIDAATGARRTVDTPSLRLQPDPQFALLPGGNAVIAAGDYPDARSRLLVSTDRATNWSDVRLSSWKTWKSWPCWNSSPLVTTGDTIRLLCFGGVAAGSSGKALLASTDLGLRWRVVSQTRNLSKPSAHGLPADEVSAFTAGDRKLWLSLVDGGVASSSDGGVHWHYTSQRGLDPGGGPSVFDPLHTAVWLLVPGTSLWRNTGGHDWRRLGPLNDRS